jgi:protein gp37
MGDTTKIEWTHHTFNPWIGCEKVSQECKHCYAEAWARRYLKNETVWGGKNATRHQTTDAYWNKPLRWNKEAGEKGVREFVFCASLADWAEDRPELVVLREKLFDVIRVTPNLIWQLLTKRYYNSIAILRKLQLNNRLPENIILGFTTGTKETVTQASEELWRAQAAMQYPPVKLFLSCEPLLEDIWMPLETMFTNVVRPDAVIIGGESGHEARPMHPFWARNVRSLCENFQIPFLFKQWGEWHPYVKDMEDRFGTDYGLLKSYFFKEGNMFMYKVGKKAAGRLLNGKTYNGMPKF